MGPVKPNCVAEDSERGREREGGRKSSFLHGRWREDAPPRVIKALKTPQ